MCRDIFEITINNYVRNYLAKDPKFQKYTVFDMSNIWTCIKEPEISEISKNNVINNQNITDFNGIFILTNDDSYFPMNINDRTIVRLRKNSTTSSSKYIIKKFVIVEAKYCLDNIQLYKKISQIERFQQYLEEARNFQDNHHKEYTIEFKNKAIYYKLNEFTTDIILIFASEDMSYNQINVIKSNCDNWLANKIEVGYFIPSSVETEYKRVRYSLYCYNESNKNFEKNGKIW